MSVCTYVGHSRILRHVPIVDASAINAYCCAARITLGSEIVLKLWVYNLSGTALALFWCSLSDSACAGCAGIF